MRFKDLRGTFLSFLLFLFDIALIINGLIVGAKIKIIFSILVFPIIVFGYLRQFYIHVYDDFIYIHHFIGILSMPVLLQFNEIENIKCDKKNRIIISANNRDYPIYCSKANDKFVYIKRKWAEYNEKN